MKRQKRSKAKKSWSVRPRTTKVKQFCRHSLYLHTPRCSSFQFDVLMNCGNSDPAHPSYPHGRLEAARINTAVKNGKGLISHYNINLTKTLDIYIPNWHEGWYFNLFVLFESYFVSWTFIKNFQKKNWRWKLTSIWLIWHPSQLIRSYKSSP